MGVINAVIRRTSQNTNEMISNLQHLIRQPSVSAKEQGLEKCAQIVCDMLKDSGLDSEILHLQKTSKKNIPPIVYAEIHSDVNPQKTVTARVSEVI